MADKAEKKPFVKTYKKYNEMTESEKNAFRQGADTNKQEIRRMFGVRFPKGKQDSKDN